MLKYPPLLQNQVVVGKYENYKFSYKSTVKYAAWKRRLHSLCSMNVVNKYQSGADNSLQRVRSVPEINATIGFKGG